jgi:hypothetical protein
MLNPMINNNLNPPFKESKQLPFKGMVNTPPKSHGDDLGMVDVIGFTTCLFFFLHNNVDLP